MKFLQKVLNTNYDLQTDDGVIHKKVKHLLLDIFVIGAVMFGIISSFYVASAASFGWTQSSWVGGANTTTASTTAHSPNLQNVTTGWDKYYSVSTGIVAAGDVRLQSTSYSFTDDGATSTTPSSSTSGGGFTNGVFSSTATTTNNASIKLSGGINPGFSATGGVITYTDSNGLNPVSSPAYTGGYTVHTFTSSGALHVVSNSADVEYLIVAGGGSGGGCGGSCASGGGGGGGVLNASGYAVNSTHGDYVVTVGAGIGGGVTTAGVNGNPSTFDTVTASGGGGGASPGTGVNAGNGGSGGGTAYNAGTPGNGIAGPPRQGYNGGTSGSTSGSGGGGGGAGGVGVSGTGGAGYTSSITGTSLTYGGGGKPGNGVYGSCTSNFGCGGYGGWRVTSGSAYSGAGSGGVVVVRYLNPTPYVSSGIFTSAVINLGAKITSPTLSWAQTLNGGTITMEVQTSADNTTWTGYSNITNGGSITVPSAGVKYVRYRATLSSVSPYTTTPTLDSVTVGYNQYNLSGNLISTKYDTGDPTNTLSSITWNSAGNKDNLGNALDGSDESVKFQIRTAASSGELDSASWCGPVDCSGSGDNVGVFTTNSGQSFTNTALTGSSNHRWIQYKVLLTSGGDLTPVLKDVNVSYVVNKKPEFDTSLADSSGTGVAVSQATTTQANTGKVLINYSIRDPDTLSGSPANIGKVYPFFQYSLGDDNWIAIATSSLATGDTDLKNVLEVGYTTYTAVWDAKSQLNINGTTVDIHNAKVRVTINDREMANNIAIATSSEFTLDTKAPVVSFKLNDTADTYTLNATDGSYINNYDISNYDDFSTQVSTPLTSTSTITLIDSPWSAGFIYGTNSIPAYSRVTDIYGNTATTTAVAPYVTDTISITDLSNTKTNQYREFLSWPLFVAVTNVSFDKYELWRSEDGGPYTLRTTITNSDTNFYTDTTVTKDSTYSYKVLMIDSDGDVSNWSNIVDDKADGQGGTDTVAPTITNIQATSTNSSGSTVNTQEIITFDTDEPADSYIEYGKTAAYGDQISSQSFLKAGHSITLGQIKALEPNTDYHYRIVAKDVLRNTRTGDDNVFTTAGGPVITSVTASSTDISGTVANVAWTTNISSDSTVHYGQDSTLATYASATGNTGTEHVVSITGLTPNTTYYYSVYSNDTNNNTTVSDSLNGTKYSFNTGNDIAPPTITKAATASVIASNFAIITWNTDKDSDSEVQYGTATGTYSFSKSESDLTKVHLVTLPKTLATSTLYHYVVKSTGSNSHYVTSDESTFTTKDKDSEDLLTDIANLNANYASQVTSLQSQIKTASGLNGTGNGSGASNDVIDKTVPVITDIKADKITSAGATITFTTNVDTISLVEYGTSTSYGMSTGDKAFAKTHTITLKGLTIGTDYHFAVDVVSKFGYSANSTDQTFKTTFIAEDLGSLAKLGDTFNSVQDKLENLITSALPSLNPPFISKPQVINAEQTTAEVDFTTNVKAYGSVQYATEEEWKKEPKYTSEMADTDNKLTDHKFNLVNLKPGSKYHYSVRSYVFNQAMAKTDDATFLTKAGDVEARVSDRKKDSFRIVWTTDKPTTSVVEYKKSGGTSAERKTDLTLNTYHDVLVDKVTPNTTYVVKVYGDDANDNRISAKAELTVTTSQDVTPPTISNFKIESTLVPGRADKIQTLISWKTDEPATTAVYYGEGSGSTKDVLPNKQEDISTLTTNHTMIITNLKPGAIYRLQVASKDDAENEAKTPMRTIITPKQSESIVDVIFSNFDSTFQFMNNIKK